MLLTAARVVTPARILAPGWVHVDGDRIVDVGAGEPPRAADLSFPAGTLVPGFVDAHAHGGGGASFDTGSAEDAAAVTRVHLAHGTTSMMASLVTAAPDVLARSVRGLADAADAGVVAGIHLEGPWLSPGRAGAHDPALLRHPEPALVDELLEAGRGHVRMVTLAPELPGGLDADPPAERRRGRRRHRAHGRVVRPPAPPSTPAPGSGPTCSTRCAALHHRDPGRSRRCSSTPMPTSS